MGSTEKTEGARSSAAPQTSAVAAELRSSFGSSPEQMRQQAHRLSQIGERREAADLLRLAVHAAEDQKAAPGRLIPLVESLAEVLWQLDEKREARLYGDRALSLYFAARG